jgi:hypothetical protein
MKEYGMKWSLTMFLWLAIIGIFSILVPMVILFVPIIIVLLYYKNDLRMAILGYIMFVAACFVLQASVMILLFVFLTLPVSISVAYLLKIKMRMYNSVLINMTVVLVGAVGFIAYLTVSSGTNVTTLIVEELAKILTMDDTITKAFYLFNSDQQLFADFVLNGTMPDQYASIDVATMRAYMLDVTKDAINMMIPNVIVTSSLAGGFLTYYISHAYLKKMQIDVVEAAPFKLLNVPRQAVNAIFAMAVISMLLSLFGLEMFNNVSSIILVVFVTVFGIQGFSVVYFFYKEKKYPLVVCIIICIASLLMGMAFWIGFFESVLKLRARYIMGKEKGGDV